MEVECLREQILHTDNAFSVVLADTPELVNAACRLQYQVYCVERGFEPGSNGVETDEFDGHARHVLLIRRQSGEVIGTDRVFPPRRSSSEATLSMQRMCQNGLMRNLPLGTTREVFHFPVSPVRPLVGYRAMTPPSRHRVAL